MKTTMALVFDGLSGRYACEKGESYKPDGIALSAYSLPTSYAGEFDDGIFIVNGYDLIEDRSMLDGIPPKKVVLVCPPGYRPSVPHAIAVVTDAPVLEVVEVAEDALHRYQEWSNDLVASALEGSSIDELVARGHALLGNPMLVLDRALRVRARTTDDVMEDELWTPLDSSTQAFSGSADLPGFADFLKLFDKGRVVSDYLMVNGRRLASCRTRFIGEDFLFICLIEKNRAISDGDVALLELVCAMVETALVGISGNEARESIGYSGLLVDAFEGRLVNSIELGNRMRALGCALKQRVRVIVSAPRKGCFNDRQAHRLMGDVSNNFPFGKCVYHEGLLVFFASYDTGKGPNASDFRRFGVFLENSNLIAGVSEDCPRTVPLQELYQTARHALSIGRKAMADTSLFFFEECRPYYLYEVCSRDGDSDFYVHPSVRAVVCHDWESKVPLYPVLRCLALNWGNRTNAARELYMQRNTLQARIRDIESLCGIDLSDPAVIAHVRHSVVLEEYCGKGA